MNRWRTRGLCGVTAVPLVGVFICSVSAEHPDTPPRLPEGSNEREVIGQFVDLYCVACHNQDGKTAGLALDAISTEDPSWNSKAWEKVVRKLALHHARWCGRSCLWNCCRCIGLQGSLARKQSPNETRRNIRASGASAAVSLYNESVCLPLLRSHAKINLGSSPGVTASGRVSCLGHGLPNTGNMIELRCYCQKRSTNCPPDPVERPACTHRPSQYRLGA